MKKQIEQDVQKMPVEYLKDVLPLLLKGDFTGAQREIDRYRRRVRGQIKYYTESGCPS